MEGNKKFLKKRNRESSKNKIKEFKNNYNKGNFNIKKKGFGVKFQNGKNKFPKKQEKDFNENLNFEENFENEEKENKEKSEVLKIAKHWEPRNLIEPINTQGKIIFDENKKIFFSIVENEIRMIDMFSLKTLKSFSYPEETFSCFNYNKNKNELVCAMNNSTMRVFDITTGKSTKLWKLTKCNGKLIKFDKAYKFIAIATTNHNLLIYNSHKFNLISSFEAHSNFIFDIEFNPDTEKFIVYTASEDNSIKAWDIVLGKNIGNLIGHKSGVRHITLTNDGKSLISVGMDNQIILWKLQNNNNTMIKSYSLDMIPPIESIFYFTRILNNNENNSGKELVPTLLTGCEDGSLLEINLKKAIINDLSIRSNFIGQSICQINYLNELKKLIAISAEQTLIYLDVDIVNKKITEAYCEKLIPGFCQEILDVKILPNLQNQNTLNDIEGENADEEVNDQIQSKENYSENYNEIYNNIEYLFTSNDNSLKYLKNNKVKLLEGHSDFIMHVDVKNNFISTSSKDNTVRIWYYNYEENEKTKEKEFNCICFAILKGHSEVVNSSALLLKKNYQIISASRDKSIKLWDFSDLITKENLDFLNISEPYTIDDAKFSEIPHDEEINMVKVSPNEKIIATCSYDKTIKIFSNKLEELGTLKGHRRAVMDISFSKYAKLIASTSSDKTIKVWNLSDYSCIKSFEGHLAGTIKVSWIYYGTHLVSSGSDGLIKFWNLKTSECINTINSHEGKIWGMDVNTQNEKIPLIASGATDAKLIQWKDITKEKEENELKLMEDKMLKEEQLRQLTWNNEYYKALKLSLDLNRKSDFVSILKKIILRKLNINNASLDPFSSNGIDLIINNRKKLEELSDESDILKINNKSNRGILALNEQKNSLDEIEIFKKSLKDLLMDKELAKVLMNPKTFNNVLEIIRDNNVKSSNFFYMQIILKMILIRKNYEDYLNNKEDNNIGIRNKGFKKNKKKSNDVKDIDYMENFEIIKSYSEKHYERINRELTKSYLIDFVLDKIKIV